MRNKFFDVVRFHPGLQRIFIGAIEKVRAALMAMVAKDFLPIASAQGNDHALPHHIGDALGGRVGGKIGHVMAMGAFHTQRRRHEFHARANLFGRH